MTEHHVAEFNLPNLGENVPQGDVLRVLVKAGDRIKQDQPVLELETDKATIEVPSTVEGTITEVKVKVGDKVKTGQLVLVVDNGGAPAATESAPAKKADAGDRGRSRRPKRAEPRSRAPPMADGAAHRSGAARSRRRRRSAEACAGGRHSRAAVAGGAGGCGRDRGRPVDGNGAGVARRCVVSPARSASTSRSSPARVRTAASAKRTSSRSRARS